MDALPPEPPPQWLPVGARWCVAQQRCIDLEVARSPEQQRLGLMQRPALPPLRGMWFPFATPQPLLLRTAGHLEIKATLLGHAPAGLNRQPLRR